NTLKNEYPALGGDFSVVHHTTFIAQMIDSGRLKLKTGVPLGTIAIHDPCYLARYNDSTGSIRKALDAIDGTRRAEVTNRGKSTFCCGAGGSQYFAKTATHKAATIRIHDLSKRAEKVATACPFCYAMLEAAKDKPETEIADVAVYVARYL
ncbi:MAG TPA: hypothetical protein DCW60_03405, partial [Sutterella sp.]|nr:hypothetical protein [Sutterella sp.]